MPSSSPRGFNRLLTPSPDLAAIVGPEPLPRTASTYEVVSSGSVVWVNSAEGCCIGRFSRHGLDVHQDAYAQMETGEECLDCVPGRPDEHGWKRFKASMLRHHGVIVDDQHKPAWIELGLLSPHLR